jgi:Ca-activated chloride channel family protein
VRAYLVHPEWLWLLAVVPLVAWRAAVGRARRRRDWAALGQSGRPPGDGSVGWLMAAVCFVVALAQPRWGRSDRPPLPPGHDVVLAVDVSRSMGAEDAVPDRLGRAVEAAESLVKALGNEEGDRAAVVAFAGKGVLRCPLTENLGAVVETLEKLKPGDVRPGGTDLAAAVDAAIEAFDDQARAEGRAVVIFSDGEDHPGAWPEALGRWRESGVVLHAVAVGDDHQGHPVPERPRAGPGAQASASPLTYRGEPVLSRRSDAALEVIAAATGGAFVPLGLSTTDLGQLYRTRIEPEARSRRAAAPAADLATGQERAERFGLFLLAGLGFGLAACRPGRGRLVTGRAWLFAAAVAALGAGPEADGSPAGLVASGRAAYAQGRFAEALAAFRRAADLRPTSAVPRYDMGATLYQLGRHGEALAAYDGARPLADPVLRTKIDFALGNTALALGKLAEAIAHYDDCLASTAPGADLDEVRRQAAANRKFVEDLARRTPPAPEGGKDPARAPDADTGADRPEPRPSDQPDRPQVADPSNAASQPGGPENPGGPIPSGLRGPGGAGGSGPAPPRPAPGSPEARLARALKNVREARRQRIDEPAPAKVSRDLKDW